MEQQFEYKGHKYWVKVEPTIHGEATVYVAYVSDYRPDGVINGESVKDPQGRTQTYDSVMTALTNANAVKQSQLDTKQ